MLLEQLRTFYFLWWNNGNIREIKTILLFAYQINISLKIINKPKFLGVPQNFPYWMGNTKKRIKLKLLVSFPDENLSLKNKSCIIKKMPATALRFAYWDSYNNHVKIVSTNTCQTKLKKILIKQKRVYNSNYISCKWGNLSKTIHCVKNVQIRSYFWFKIFYIRVRNNSVFGHFSHSDHFKN